MDIIAALADPVRRSILEALNARPMTAGEVARRFPISRPAVSRHLRVLREAGLVTANQSGRERIYRVELEPLAELDTWLAQFRDHWTPRFDALETEVHRTRREREREEAATQMSPAISDSSEDTKEQPA